MHNNLVGAGSGGSGGAGIRPTPSTSSSSCYDSYRCTALAKIRICTSPSFSESLRKTLCPKLCGFCE
ncbi:shTK domain protein [Ancylostoma caninum]|uniref:ShTK domain protein n=1 Tax=Ancylostoma caninum TaxID=29170 RepID=A0A368GUH3_ANCCA|nr:shTK domain protein [Ancylostoma caninum]